MNTATSNNTNANTNTNPSASIEARRSVTVEELFKEVREITDLFEVMGIAEDEIEQAQRRHPHAADTIWHSFRLLRAEDRLMQRNGHLYRAHCREILDRVAASEDTRPGTAAEILCAASAVSKVVPLNAAAFGLYARAFKTVFPDQPFAGDLLDDAQHMEHVEALHGEEIDDLTADTRRRLSQKDRALTEITCCGMHNGEPVGCAYGRGQAA